MQLNYHSLLGSRNCLRVPPKTHLHSVKKNNATFTKELLASYLPLTFKRVNPVKTNQQVSLSK